MSHRKRKRADTSSLNEGITCSKRSRLTTTNSAHTHTHPNTSATHEHRKVKDLQTLSHSSEVRSLDMCATEDMTAAFLVTGLKNGEVCIYRTPLSQWKPIRFDLLKRFHAHTDYVSFVHMNATKAVFVTGCYDYGFNIWMSRKVKAIKIWRLREVKAPLLMKCIHPEFVTCVAYSPSGLLLTGGYEGVLRVYRVEPLWSLVWSCKVSNHIISVAWSPSNLIAASFYSRDDDGFRVRVWDSTFHPLFEHKHVDPFLCKGMLFASDDILLCVGGRQATDSLHSYNIRTSKVITYHQHRSNFGLSSEIVCTPYIDQPPTLVYKLCGSQLRVLATLSHTTDWTCPALASCMYSAGFVLASASIWSKDVHISWTSRLNAAWVLEVTKMLLFTARILPFCTDVHKIIFKYL